MMKEMKKGRRNQQKASMILGIGINLVRICYANRGWNSLKPTCVLLWNLVSSKGPRMSLLLAPAPEPQTAVKILATPFHLILTRMHNLPPASQAGPRREAVAGREAHQTTR